MPAVDGFNAKLDGFGGIAADNSFYGGSGSFSMPLGQRFGLQVDGTFAALDDRLFAAGGGHLFTRDPAIGLLGPYGSTSHWDKAGGINTYHFGVEGGWYLGRWSVDGVAGVEGGNSGSVVTGGLVQSFDIRTRFFDQVDLSYYLTDNLKVFVGHRYLGGAHAAALGGEWGFGLGGGRMAALFVEGRLGDDDARGVWGGLRVYFGQRDKTLMARHRQDDPKNWLVDDPTTAGNSSSETPVVNKKKCTPQQEGGSMSAAAATA